MICLQYQSRLVRQRIDTFKITNTTKHVARFQPLIEMRIAIAREPPVVIVRPVKTNDAGRSQMQRNAIE